MAAVHEIADVVKKINTPLLERLFKDKLRVELSVDWKTITKRKNATLVKQIEALPDTMEEAVNDVLSDIAEAGRDTRNVPTILDAMTKLGIAYKQEDFEDFNPQEVATWAYIACDDVQWAMIKRWTEIDNYPRGEWKAFDLKFVEEEPELGAAAAKKAELEKAIMECVSKKEPRGKHCESEIYTVGNRETCIFKLNDRKTTEDEFNETEKKFDQRKVSRAFQIVFTFDYDDDRLSVIYPSNPRRGKAVCQTWADTVFGKGQYSELKAVQYTIDQFLNRESSTLPTDPNSPITSAKVVGLDLTIGNSKERRRSITELRNDIYTEFRRELNESVRKISDFKLKRVRIQVTYNTKKRSGIRKSFSVTESSASNLSNAKSVSKMIKDYMRFLKIMKDGKNAPTDGQTPAA